MHSIGLLVGTQTRFCLFHIGQIQFPKINVQDFDQTSLKQLKYIRSPLENWKNHSHNTKTDEIWVFCTFSTRSKFLDFICKVVFVETQYEFIGLMSKIFNVLNECSITSCSMKIFQKRAVVGNTATNDSYSERTSFTCRFWASRNRTDHASTSYGRNSTVCWARTNRSWPHSYVQRTSQS